MCAGCASGGCSSTLSSPVPRVAAPPSQAPWRSSPSWSRSLCARRIRSTSAPGCRSAHERPGRRAPVGASQRRDNDPEVELTQALPRHAVRAFRQCVSFSEVSHANPRPSFPLGQDCGAWLTIRGITRMSLNSSTRWCRLFCVPRAGLSRGTAGAVESVERQFPWGARERSEGTGAGPLRPRESAVTRLTNSSAGGPRSPRSAGA